jgi:hypothetical protein
MPVANKKAEYATKVNTQVVTKDGFGIVDRVRQTSF